MTNEILTGYHFTTSSAWKNIRKNGLIPYDIPKMRDGMQVIGKNKGIWLWQRIHRHDALVGAVIHRIIAHHETSIVLLECKFSEKYSFVNIVKKKIGTRWVLSHTGNLSDDDRPDDRWTYHSGELSFIVVNRIPPQNIKRLATFNLRSILNKTIGVSR